MKHASAILLGLALCLGFSTPASEGAELAGRPPVGEQDAAQAAFAKLLAGQGLRLDRERGLLGVPVSVAIKHDLLEYLLVGPEGKGHESLLGTNAKPSVVNAALLALGATPGKNASWIEPTEERAAELVLPSGDGHYLYVAWREEEEVYFYRVEDVITNIQSGRSLRRHKWIYLGSRFASPREGAPKVFVADATGNLINLSFFYGGNTLSTSALPECVEQAIWSANAPLLPASGAQIQLIFAKERMRALPADWEAALPVVQAPDPEAQAADAR